MAQVMDVQNMDFDGSFWPADAFKGADEESDEELEQEKEEAKGEEEAELGNKDEEAEEQADAPWQESQKNKLQSIIRRRRTIAMPSPAAEDEDDDDDDEGKASAAAPDKASSRRFTPAIRERSTRSMRRSRSYGNSVSPHPASRENSPALRRTQSRDSVSPSRRMSRESSSHFRRTKGRDSMSPPPPRGGFRERAERGSRDHSNPRDRSIPRNSMSKGSSPREARKVRSAKASKKPPRRCQSMDLTKNILDQDSLNGSMEFNTQESSPIARHSTRSSGSNSGIRNSGSSARLMPRLSTGGSGSCSPIASREEQIEARRQKMLKRKTSLKAGSLRRLMDAEAANASSSKQDLGDEISIDDTVQIMDDSDEGKKSSKSRLENSRRASRTSLLDSTGDDQRTSMRSRRGQRTSGDEHSASKSRRSMRSRSTSFEKKYESHEKHADSVSWGRKGQRPSVSGGGDDDDGKSRRGTRTSTSKRDQLKKTLSDKPDRRGNRRKSSSALPGRSKSFSHQSVKAQQAKKVLEESGDEQEFSSEELAKSKSLRKIKSVGDEKFYNTAKAGVEQLANLSIGSRANKDNGSSKKYASLGWPTGCPKFK